MMGTMTRKLPPEFFDGDAWTGGWYELAIQLGPRNDVQLQAAIGILAQAADIAGPWHVQRALNSIEPASWTVADLEEHHLSGELQLPDGRQVICAVIGICLDHDDGWLALCIPLEALCRGDPRVGAFPFDDDDSASLTWRRPIDDWFAYLAGEVRAETGFRLAAIGWEASCWGQR
jgi:hypothetical protein